MGPRHTKDDGLRQRLWSMAAFGSWQIANDGAQTNGGGIVGDVTLTNAPAAFCQVFDPTDDNAVLISISGDLTGWAANYQLTSDVASLESNEASHFGNDVPFCEIALDLATVATFSGDNFVWEYHNGTSWSALTLVLDNTDTTAQDGKRSFQRSGAISFIPPTDWVAGTIGQIGSSTVAYWIRARQTGGTVTQTPLLNSIEHDIVTPLDGFIVPASGTITGIRVIDGAAVLHTTTDVKFILMNFTTGAHSGELTWSQDQRQDAFKGLSLAVSGGDELGVLVTQEDSNSDDPTNVMLELDVSV